MDKRNGVTRNDEIIGRISDLLKKKGKYEKDLISYLGLGKGTFANWKGNRSDSYLHFLKEIAEYLGVTPNDILLEEDAFVEDSRSGLLTKEELRIVEMYRSIGLNNKKHVIALLESMVEHE